MSPFKSEAQRRKFAILLKEGKISKQMFDEWNTATKKEGAPLPERANWKAWKSKRVEKVKKI